MRLSRTALPLLPLAAALVLAGCGGSSAGEGPGNGAGGPTSTGPRSSAATSVPTTTAGVATPDAAETAQLLAALSAVDPGLAVNATEAVSKAVALCVSLGDGADPTTAVGSSFPDVDLDAAQQQAVAAAVTSTFCTTAGTSSAGVATSAATASPTAS